MYSWMHVLEPVSKDHNFRCTRRLKQRLTAQSVMQKSVVACATKRLSSSRIVRINFSNAQLSHKPNKGYSGFPDNF